MEFSFTAAHDDQPVKRLLKSHGVSKRLLAIVKFDGGQILVNGQERNAVYRLTAGDTVTIQVPDEAANPALQAQPDFPLDVAYEDAHYLLVNKPAGVASITG